VAKRVVGFHDEMTIAESRLGVFAKAKVSGSRLLLIPVPVDHQFHQGDLEIEATLRYMINARNAALEIIDKTLPATIGNLYVDQVVFCFENVLGRIEESVAQELGFDGDHRLNNMLLSPTHPLAGVRERISWADILGTDPIKLANAGLTVGELFEEEKDFCSKLWPRDQAGRWSKVLLMLESLQLSKLFAAFDSRAKAGGWRVNHLDEYSVRFVHEIEYLHPDNPCHIRIQLSRSSPAAGIVVIAGEFDEESHASKFYSRLNSPADFETLFETLAPTPTKRHRRAKRRR
jgi:hypothetical protein